MSCNFYTFAHLKRLSRDIGAIDPIIIAFGNDAFKILKMLKDKNKIFKVPHYSSCITKEKLRIAFNEISKEFNN